MAKLLAQGHAMSNSRARIPLLLLLLHTSCSSNYPRLPIIWEWPLSCTYFLMISLISCREEAGRRSERGDNTETLPGMLLLNSLLCTLWQVNTSARHLWSLIILAIRNGVSGVWVTSVSACLWVGGQRDRSAIQHLSIHWSRIQEVILETSEDRFCHYLGNLE